MARSAEAQVCGDAGQQSCEDGGATDGGTSGSEGDGGVQSTRDASVIPPVLIPEMRPRPGGSSTGSGAAGSASGSGTPACSCTHDSDDDGRGRVHVCTGSYDQSACDALICENDPIRSVPCSTSGVLYCCQMPSRDLYSHLYSDCRNDNCEAGFFAQCADFGGTIIDGPCDTPDSVVPFVPTPEPDTNDDGLCAMSPGRAGGSGPLAVTVGVLALAFGTRRRCSSPLGKRQGHPAS